MAQDERGAPPERPRALYVAALLGGNFALALGPWSVRLADSGPVAAGFWRLILALPLLLVLARTNRQPLHGFPPRMTVAVIAAGLAFALDLASWHIGIGQTRLGNATLFGNSGSLILMAWGLVRLRRWPRTGEWLALAAALGGTVVLMGRSLEIGTASFAGDLFCLLAGLFYAIYILILHDARARLGNWSLLGGASIAGAPLLLGIALMLGEPVWPHRWWPLFTLALGSQIVGQGLLVYALRHFRPLVIGLALLTQPGIAVLAGRFAFGETLTVWDVLGMALVAAALVLVRAGEAK
ncbi:MAG: EamA family transporter [Novosphingobium sp.]|nr:EamA family transporter [Novosphingobium sp.]